jgi:hypothetical protein
MNNQAEDLNSPSFFRRGGLLMPLGPGQVHIQVGKNQDGSWYIDLNGQPVEPGHMRSCLSPRQMFDLCTGTLGHMGYGLELKPPDQDSYDMMVAEANRA